MRLNGGYDLELPWLAGASHVDGMIEAFIPGQNKTPAAVVHLDRTLVTENASGDRAVLELRFGGATWTDTQTVHVELCNFVPDHETWAKRRQGVWVESHASYQRL